MFRLRQCEQIKGQTLQKTTRKTKKLNLRTNTLRILVFVEKIQTNDSKSDPFWEPFFEILMAKPDGKKISKKSENIQQNSANDFANKSCFLIFLKNLQDSADKE